MIIKKYRQKGFVLTTVLMAIGILVLGTGIVYLVKSIQTVDINSISCTEEAKQCPDGSFVSRVAPDCEFAGCSNSLESDLVEMTEVDKLTEELTSDWKTYKSEEYGLKFKYPANRKPSITEDGFCGMRDFYVSVDDFIFEVSDAGFGAIFTRDQASTDYKFIDGYIGTLGFGISSQSGNELYTMIKRGGLFGRFITATKEITSETITAKITAKKREIESQSRGSKDLDYNNRNFNIWLRSDEFTSELKSDIDEMSLILSTFKPYKPVKDVDKLTTGWKIYKSEEYGFEFNYPDYVTLKEINKDSSFVRGSKLKQYLFSADSMCISGLFSIYKADDNFGIHDRLDYYNDVAYLNFYQNNHSDWELVGSDKSGCNPSFPYSRKQTINGVAIYEDSGYKGMLDSHKLIVSPDGTKIIDFYFNLDSKSLILESQEAQEFSQKFSKDIEDMLKYTFKFTD